MVIVMAVSVVASKVMSFPELPSYLLRAAPEFGREIGVHRCVTPTPASVYFCETVPDMPRLALRNMITSLDVIAGLEAVAVVEVIEVLKLRFL